MVWTTTYINGLPDYHDGLIEADDDCRWVTMNGTHVCITKGHGKHDISEYFAKKHGEPDKAALKEKASEKSGGDTGNESKTSAKTVPLTRSQYENRIHERWTTNSDSNVARALQAVASRKFGGQVWNWKAAQLQDSDTALKEVLPKLEKFHSLSGEHITKATEDFVDKQYAKTQKALKNAPDTMKLYRATAQPLKSEGGSVHFEMDALNSFTMDLGIAKAFRHSIPGAQIVEVEVPKSSIFGHYKHGFGVEADSEVTVLGGKKRWTGKVVS